MHSNAQLIKKLYTALDRHNHESMAACYHSRPRSDLKAERKPGFQADDSTEVAETEKPFRRQGLPAPQPRGQQKAPGVHRQTS